MIQKLCHSKITIAIISAAASLLLFVTPIIVAAGVISVPINAIHELFTNIGDFLFGGDDDNQVIVIINEYLKQDDTKKEIKQLYQPLINNSEENIPLNWLLIPNLLAGIKDVDKDMIKQEIRLLKQSENDLETFINLLREQDPWKTGLSSNVSTTTIVGYVNQFNSYLGQEGSIDVGNLKDEEFLYPLKKKAVVTSEFGQRWPVTLPNGTVVNQPHDGTDLAYAGGDAATCGVPVYAAMSGTIVANERTQGQAGANWGSIRFKNLDIWYLHLRDPFPYEVGTKIKKGQFVGYIGNTGLSTACHLHFETHVNGKPVNARKFLDF